MSGPDVWALAPGGGAAGPCRGGFLPDPLTQKPRGRLQRVRIPRPEVQGLRSPRGGGDTL